MLNSVHNKGFKMTLDLLEKLAFYKSQPENDCKLGNVNRREFEMPSASRITSATERGTEILFYIIRELSESIVRALKDK